MYKNVERAAKAPIRAVSKKTQATRDDSDSSSISDCKPSAKKKKKVATYSINSSDSSGSRCKPSAKKKKKVVKKRSSSDLFGQFIGQQ